MKRFRLALNLTAPELHALHELVNAALVPGRDVAAERAVLGVHRAVTNAIEDAIPTPRSCASCGSLRVPGFACSACGYAWPDERTST